MPAQRLEQPTAQHALVNGRVILPHAVVGGLAVVIHDGKIGAIVDQNELDPRLATVDAGGRYIAPGLIDIHVHGALGYTFNEATTTSFATITQTLAAHGVTAFLATIATASIPDLVACLKRCGEWMRRPQAGAQMLGVHLEGPYFSPAQAGAQDPGQLRTPDDGTVDSLLQHHRVIKMMSFAPELPGAHALTSRLVRLGIVPAAGHSAVSDADVAAAIAVGLRHVIHLWSGQSSTVRAGPWRRPGLLEAALASDDVTAELIADGKHLPPTLMKLAYKCLGPDQLCLISDATSGAGLPEGSRFRMGAMEYEVKDGVGMLLDHSAFAGSTTLLNRMIPIFSAATGVPLFEAVRMASLTPARVIGCDRQKGSLETGKDADLTIFEEDFSVWRTMIGGRWVYLD